MQITQELIDRITVQNRNWWIDIRTGEPLLRNVGEMIALVHSELSEAFEGWLNNSHDDKLPQYLQFHVEIIDAIIRGCDIAGGLGISGDVLMHYKAAPRCSVTPLGGLLTLHKTLSDALEADRKKTGNFAMYLGWFLAQCVEFLYVMKVYQAAEILEAKLQYNATRHDHSIAGRLAADGKRY